MSETPVENLDVEDSILASIKKVVNIHDSYTDFDVDVMMHINSAIFVLTQLGVGPPNGFAISGREDSWGDFIGNNPIYSAVKTFVALSVRMVFDPPGTSYHINAMQEQIKELAVRINIQRESTQWVDPTPADLESDDVMADVIILDGGTG